MSRWGVHIVLAAVVLAHCQLVNCRPQEKSTSSENVVKLRQDVELNQETQIGDSKVYGLIHNESEDKDAKQEKEDFDSRVQTVFENIQQKIINLLNPGAVVDKATAKDYESNPIEPYEAFRQGIVNGVDFLAKQLNSALDTPKSITKKVNKSITKSLNDIGAKLVGLE